MTVKILQGDCREVLGALPDESVHCVVTSPPYWGLRDYGASGQVGREPTPAGYVETMVAIFRQVRLVLRRDGTLWFNMGDCYIATPRGNRAGDFSTSSLTYPGRQDRLWGKHLCRNQAREPRMAPGGGLKRKDLVGMPWRLAFALQADGWFLRQDIIWSKPNPMPESVTDRCTKAHEYIFLLSKSEQYFFDQEAILESCSPNTHARLAQDVEAQIGSDRAHAGGKTNGRMKAVARRGGGNRSHKGTDAYEQGAVEHRTKAGLVTFAERQRNLAEAGSGMLTQRNKRSVWTVGTMPFKAAHFATFPPALIEPCILAGCPQGGTVLDPFGGAGTTGLVADRLGRDAILIDLNPKYCAMADARLRGDLRDVEDEPAPTDDHGPLFAEAAR